METVQKLKSVLTIQEVDMSIPEEQIEVVKLRDMLKAKGIFAKLNVSEQSFFDNFAVLVNAARVEPELGLDTEISQRDQVVILPRIVGG